MERGLGRRDAEGGEPRRVAIIGGGLGGLTAAAFLHGQTSKDGRWTYACEVFEASTRIGGNMWTAYLRDVAEPADLAVNDFNAATYKEMMALLATLEAAGHKVEYGPLLDEASFFTAPDAGGAPVSFTTDEVAAPWRHLSRPYLWLLWWDLRRFRGYADEVMHDERYAGMTVAEFVREKRFTDTFRDLMLYPRINAMYFVSGTPGGMPIRGVMYYYLLQEGYGSPEAPRRMFFKQGASAWAEALLAYVKGLGATVRLGADATASEEGGRLRVAWRDAAGQHGDLFDLVVCAVQPAQVERVVPFVAPALLTRMHAFGAFKATATVHRDERVMPPDKRHWRTYNVLIDRSGRPYPYTMSYVNAMHSGKDEARPPFVSETTRPRPDTVYQMRDLADPSRGYVDARAEFTHNTVSLGTMAFQARLHEHQGGHGVYYTGGWTNGAGLQEQIIAQSRHVADLILGRADPDDHESYRADRPGYVPRHVRRALGR